MAETEPAVAVVTGGNKGIGYAIVKGLCENFDGNVYLTSRDINRGKKAVLDLRKLGLYPHYHQLDITDQYSVDRFKEHIVKNHGGIDVLINNAAIAYKNDATKPFSKQAEETIDVNYFSLLRICISLFPLLRNNAQVVNVSSAAGHLSRIPSSKIREKFSSLTMFELNNIMEQFVNDAKDDVHVEGGWGDSAYAVSKVGVSALTILQQEKFDKEEPNRNISVNSVHPGHVNTDMTRHRGPLTIEEGAKAPLYLALKNHNLKGKYVWCDNKVVDWYGENTPARY